MNTAAPRRRILSHFAPDIARERWRLAAGMGFAVVYAIARVAEPWPLKVVFDQVLFHKPAHGLIARTFTFLGTSPNQLLGAAAVVLAVAGLVRGVSYYYEDFLLSRAAQEIVYRIRARLYRHLHRLPISFHQRRSTGDTLVRLSSDILMLRDVLVDAIVNLGTGVILVALMLAVMFSVDPVLTASRSAPCPQSLSPPRSTAAGSGSARASSASAKARSPLRCTRRSRRWTSSSCMGQASASRSGFAR